jgi:hypothetical protein
MKHCTTSKSQKQSSKLQTAQAISSSQETRTKTTKQKLKASAVPAYKICKQGLPLETQKALLDNVLRYQGFDDFARGTCDHNPALFGE